MAEIQLEGGLFDEETLATFDTTYLFIYAIATYAGGVVGDIYDLRKLLTFSFFGLSFSYFLLGLGGYQEIESTTYYYGVFLLIGIFSSPVFPSFVHLMGSWFP